MLTHVPHCPTAGKTVDDAEADFHRMADIYRSVYAGKHYYIGIAESNLADVYVEKRNY